LSKSSYVLVAAAEKTPVMSTDTVQRGPREDGTGC
jgi:hypothetical protein